MSRVQHVSLDLHCMKTIEIDLIWVGLLSIRFVCLTRGLAKNNLLHIERGKNVVIISTLSES